MVGLEKRRLKRLIAAIFKYTEEEGKETESAEGLCCCCSVAKLCLNLCNSMVQKEKRVAEDEMRWLRAYYVSSTMLSIIRPHLTASFNLFTNKGDLEPPTLKDDHSSRDHIMSDAGQGNSEDQILLVSSLILVQGISEHILLSMRKTHLGELVLHLQIKSNQNCSSPWGYFVIALEAWPLPSVWSPRTIIQALRSYNLNPT